MLRLAPRRTSAGIGCGRAGDHLQQCGLPCAVASHDGPALAAADGEAEALVDYARAVALVEVFEDGYLIAGARRHAEFEFHDLALLGQFDLFDFVQGFDAALDLRGFGGVGLKRSIKRCSLASMAC